MSDETQIEPDYLDKLRGPKDIGAKKGIGQNKVRLWFRERRFPVYQVGTWERSTLRHVSAYIETLRVPPVEDAIAPSASRSDAHHGA